MLVDFEDQLLRFEMSRRTNKTPKASTIKRKALKFLGVAKAERAIYNVEGLPDNERFRNDLVQVDQLGNNVLRVRLFQNESK